MKKVILSAIAICAFGFANAQSNKQGTIHVNVMGGFLMGSATGQSNEAGSEKAKYSATYRFTVVRLSGGRYFFALQVTVTFLFIHLKRCPYFFIYLIP